MLGWIVDRTAKHDRNQVLLVDEYLNNLWYTHAMGYAFSGKRIWALNLGQDKEKYANTEHRERLILETTQWILQTHNIWKGQNHEDSS